MKKKKMFIILGLILLALGSILFIMKGNKKEEKIINNSTVLSDKEAESLITDTVRRAINVYENPSSIFQTEQEENSSYTKILNYDMVIGSIFSTNGIKELENIKIGNTNFFKKDNDNIYFLNNIKEDNRLSSSNIIINAKDIKEKKISCEVTFTIYSLQSDDSLSYYVIVKNLVLVKEDNKNGESVWLVDSFNYNND